MWPDSRLGSPPGKVLKHQPNDVETSPDASPRYVHIFWASLELSGNTAGEIEAPNTTPAHHRQEMNMFSIKSSYNRNVHNRFDQAGKDYMGQQRQAGNRMSKTQVGPKTNCPLVIRLLACDM